MTLDIGINEKKGIESLASFCNFGPVPLCRDPSFHWLVVIVVAVVVATPRSGNFPNLRAGCSACHE